VAFFVYAASASVDLIFVNGRQPLMPIKCSRKDHAAYGPCLEPVAAPLPDAGY
jgi:hypothetical protein